MITPNDTRWNSTFDAMQFLLEIKDKLNDLMDALDLRRFTSQEIVFLEEYVTLMKPLAITLDQLQSNSASLGMVLPAMVKLEKFWTDKISEGTLRICEPLARFLLWDLKDRTTEFFEDKDYLLGKTEKNNNVFMYLLKVGTYILIFGFMIPINL